MAIVNAIVMFSKWMYHRDKAKFGLILTKPDIDL